VEPYDKPSLPGTPSWVDKTLAFLDENSIQVITVRAIQGHVDAMIDLGLP